MYKLLSRSYQSLSEIICFFCVAILLSVFAILIILLAIQGIRYFVPAQVYLITVDYPDQPSKQFFERDKSAIKALQQRLEIEYHTAIGGQPELQITSPIDVAEISTDTGSRYLGFIQYFTSDVSNNVPPDEIDNLLLTVKLLQTQRQDVKNRQLANIHKQLSKLQKQGVATDSPAYLVYVEQFRRWQLYVNQINQRLGSFQVVIKGTDGRTETIGLNNLDRLIYPNNLSAFEVIRILFQRLWQFLSEHPKQDATSGGVYPAIFGTFLMVLLMAIIVTPFGLIAAVYLHEYAPNNRITALIRIGVSNMAAVPSVVYGVFGLGFFVYTLGGSIDQLLFSETLPAPTFGTPGILWASLTMGLLTLPVVIVAAEEGLARVPKGQREGSYALGATKIETIMKVVLPMASPGMLTGLILAVARAAGEVAPLILVGAVKFAPSLPVDGTFPFLHLERQFMHLGVFIYDGAFHSQIDNRASSMMFASCMLLILMVFVLNLAAVLLRRHLREIYERSLI